MGTGVPVTTEDLLWSLMGAIGLILFAGGLVAWATGEHWSVAVLGLGAATVLNAPGVCAAVRSG